MKKEQDAQGIKGNVRLKRQDYSQGRTDCSSLGRYNTAVGVARKKMTKFGPKVEMKPQVFKFPK